MTDAAEKGLDLLLQRGVLGVMLVLSLLAVVYLFKILMNANNERIKDLLEFKETVDTNTKSIKDTADAVRELSARVERLISIR